MAITTYAYDPERVSVIIGGNAISGFAEGSFITVSFEEDAVSYNGGLGDGAAVLNPSREGNFQLTLIQSAESNADLQVYASRVRSRQGIWYFPVLITNNSGGEIASADAAWVVKEPDLALAKTLQNKVWPLKTGNLQLNHNASYEVINVG